MITLFNTLEYNITTFSSILELLSFKEAMVIQQV